MATFYLFLAFAITPGLFVHANDVPEEAVLKSADPEIVTNSIGVEDAMLKDIRPQADWMDMFMAANNNNMFPMSSAAMMSQATNSNKTVEEQLEDIKAMAQQITLAIQSEMANLLAYAMSTVKEKANKEQNTDDSCPRTRRSIETPMDSTQLVMRLLKHIKSNNEYQNIAIDKMMSAQEIAEKYNIPFNPDPEILSDLAMAANEHAQELTNMLGNQARDMKNISEEKVSFVPLEKETIPLTEQAGPYYVYAVSSQDEDVYNKQNYPSYEYTPELIQSYHHNNHNIPNYDSYYNTPYETQIPAPHHHHHAPVSQKPSFYDLFTPQNDYYSDPYTVMMPFEDIEDPEPKLVGEEFEETVTSKVIVDRGDEPGSATVNHVMTYTVSEKSHFKTPEIARLPQQVQYCFLLI